MLTKALKRYAERVGEARPHIDLVKLSHHGSNANVSTAMLELIDCHRFLISTNGDNFAHPDDAAIAKTIMSSDNPVTLQLPHRTYRAVGRARSRRRRHVQVPQGQPALHPRRGVRGCPR